MDRFVKRFKSSSSASTSCDTPSVDSITANISEDSVDLDEKCSTSSTSNTVEDRVTTTEKRSSIHDNDIGLYIGSKKKAVDDNKKYILLSNPWKPDRDYQLPFSAHNKNNKTEKRYLSQSHLEKFQNWLTFSHVEQGLYCKFCALMSDCGGISHQTPLQKLVKKPLTTFAKLLGKDGDLVTHEQHNCFDISAAAPHDWDDITEHPSVPQPMQNLISKDKSFINCNTVSAKTFPVNFGSVSTVD
uniref:TTF-type domain-containing protein n=1 Tax=Biomphalaria glabrata TaxID=6526 RepID=A0A2C9KY83_BIOGL